MINLLPPSHRQTIKLERLSILVRRWLVVIWFATAGLIVIFVAGWLYINQQSKNLRQSIADTQAQLQAQNLTQVQKDAKTLTGNIRTINKVLNSEVRFSDLITDIGHVMPPGTVLNSLSLAQVSGGIDLSANASNYTAAARVAVNLADPNNKIFTKVDIVNISCNSKKVRYPCTGDYRALFDTKTQAKYLGVANGGQQ